jgi:hypothetical protein
MEPLFDKIARHVRLRGKLTAGPAFMLSVVFELSFFVVTLFSGGDDWFSQAFACFHYPATFITFGWLAPDDGVYWQAVVWVLLEFLVAVLQWWLIILTAIWTIRYFRRKHDKPA